MSPILELNQEPGTQKMRFQSCLAPFEQWKSKTRVASSNPRVTSSNPRDTSSNPRVTS